MQSQNNAILDEVLLDQGLIVGASDIGSTSGNPGDVIKSGFAHKTSSGKLGGVIIACKGHGVIGPRPLCGEWNLGDDGIGNGRHLSLSL